MKRYLLFVHETYYPYGGWGDFIESSDSIDKLIDGFSVDKFKHNMREEDICAELVDLEIMRPVKVFNFDVGWADYTQENEDEWQQARLNKPTT
jgi:hypothetical protein